MVLTIKLIGKPMKKRFLAISVFALLAGCSSKSEFKIPENPQVVGLASAFVLPVDTASLYLQDYILDLSTVDSVSAIAGCELELSRSKEVVKIKVVSEVAPISIMSVWCKGTAYAIPMKRSVKKAVTFSYNPAGADYTSVKLAGDINNWQPDQTVLTQIGANWETTLILNPGRYSYQVVLDGKWKLDRNNQDSTSNGMGGFNSILKVDAGNAEKAPVLFTKSHSEKGIVLSAENDVKEWVVLWENYRLPADFVTTEGSSITIQLPDAAKKAERSHLRVWGYNADGLSNDLLIPLKEGNVVEAVADLKRDDFHTSVLYFMLVDRFMNGDSLNDKPVDDPRIDFKANYQGGDLAGITQKLKEGYFKDLGVNTLWFSPIVQNPTGAWQEYPEPRRWFSGYHGYWPVLETKVDTRFGTDAVLEELVTEAHKQNNNVVMDFVSNHIHKENPLYKSHPEWFSSMYLPDGKVNIRIWDEQRLTTWFDDFMPDIDYTKPAAVNAFTDSAIYWLKKFKLDGFRHDATKHVSETFWRSLTRKIKQEVIKPENRNVYQIGETFGSRELINSYIGTGMLDAQFDFNLYFDARPVFASEAESFEKVAASMNESALYYGSHSTMGNITGNHDMPRFLYYAGGAQRLGEDEKEAGWSRKIEVEDPRGYSRLKMLHAFVSTIPGIPIIYYGDEIGMPGANDPDNRRMMRFSDLKPEEQDVKTTVTKLCNMRKSSMALCYGDTRILKADKHTLIFMRQYFDHVSVIAMNRSGEAIDISLELPSYINTTNLKPAFGSAVKIDGQTIHLNLKALSFDIVSNENV
jgi:cyclomaltodextrinase / maltogenic alpha-amylase / neopullulanase